MHLILFIFHKHKEVILILSSLVSKKMSKSILHKNLRLFYTFLFRFYSLQWKTWGACFIQAAWHRYKKKKAEKLSREAEERIQALENEEGSSPSFAATVYASRFASSVLCHLRSGKRSRVPQPKRLLPLMPQKPAEPDFSAYICRHSNSSV